MGTKGTRGENEHWVMTQEAIAKMYCFFGCFNMFQHKNVRSFTMKHSSCRASTNLERFQRQSPQQMGLSMYHPLECPKIGKGSTVHCWIRDLLNSRRETDMRSLAANPGSHQGSNNLYTACGKYFKAPR